MAVRQGSPTAVAEPWMEPGWPPTGPDAASARVVYGHEADELVVRFAGAVGRRSVSVPIETPDRDYVLVIADDETGAVLGVQVDNLLAFASRAHPSWARLAEPDPPAAVVGAFLADVAGLFARYGAGETPPRR